MECDDVDEECVPREDGADGIRAHLARRYDANTLHVPGIDVAKRAATILGVPIAGMTDAAAIALVSLRADAEWNEEDHPRGEGGKFGAGDSGRDAARKGETASTPQQHREAASAHREASGAHFKASRESTGPGSSDAARQHMDASKAHVDAARAHEKAAASDYAPVTQAARDKSDRARASTYAAVGRPDPAAAADDRVKGARKLSDQATDATIRANSTGSKEDHARAAELHGRALVETRAVGDSARMRYHGRNMDDHEKAAGAVGGAAAAKPSFASGSQSDRAYAARKMEQAAEDGRRAEQARASLAAADRKSPEGAHAAPQSGAPQIEHARAHAARASDHAEAARTAASGTSPAARASARKAAESAALAKVAADHGDHAKAKEHADRAEGHARAASEKADAHRGTTPPVTPKSVTTANMGASRENASKASAAADRASSSAKSSTDHMAAGAMHQAAASAQRAAGAAGEAAHHESMAEAHAASRDKASTKEAKTSAEDVKSMSTARFLEHVDAQRAAGKQPASNSRRSALDSRNTGFTERGRRGR